MQRQPGAPTHLRARIVLGPPAMRALVVAIVCLGGIARAQPAKPDPCSGEPVTSDDAAKNETDEPAPPPPPPPPPTSEAPPPTAPPPPESKPTASALPIYPDYPQHVQDGFVFGSYGRAITGTDLRGGAPEQIAVVAHAPRIVEPTYFELQLEYGFHAQGAEMRTVTTMAFNDDLFHYTGVFDAQPAVRN